jgi:hypothetical protein
METSPRFPDLAPLIDGSISSNDLAFDWAYTHLVEDQIYTHCAESFHPWESPDFLRDWWHGLLIEPNTPMPARLAAALALARSTHLSPDQWRDIQHFFATFQAEGFDPRLVVLLLVTGPNPPPLLWEAYFLPALREAHGPLHSSFWIMLGWFLRAPGNVELAAATVQAHQDHPDMALGFVAWLARLNPLLLPPPESSDLWHLVLQTIHPRTQSAPQGLVPDLIAFAWSLRWDQPALRSALLTVPSPLNWPLLHKRVWTPIACDPQELLNPPRTLLDHINNPAHERLAEIWRFFLPTLRYPWDTPSLPYASDDGEWLALSIMGHPPDKAITDPSSRLAGILRHHPGVSFCAK